VQLTVGAIYHWLGYEDEEMSRPMISSLEYLGLDIHGAMPEVEGPRHFFRIAGTDEEVMFAEKHLPELVDVAGLIEKLRRFQAGTHRLPPTAH
jgi:hypothetical protein